MAIIRAFRGLRPDPKLALKVAAPPYDVLGSQEARKLAKNNPYNFLHISKPEIDLPEDIDIYDKRVYQKGSQNLRKFIDEKILIQEDSACLYIYQLIMGEHEQTGIVATASVEDYNKGIIKIHEYTREDKEKDRTDHVNILNANTGPVFLTYHATNKINSIVDNIKNEKKPIYDFASEDGIKHTIWKIHKMETIGKIEKDFQEIKHLYISDGHHRSASAANVQKMRKNDNPDHTGEEEYNFFLSVIFPDNEMYIMDYNRVVKDLNNLSNSIFLDKIRKYFDVYKQEEQFKPTKKHIFGMYLDKEWYKLSAKPNTYEEYDPVNSLDVSILHNNLIEPILGISNPRQDKRIGFVGGIRGLNELEKLVDSKKYQVAFALYPTSINDLINVADANKVMPPKSTWFEPKLRSGLIIHLL